MLKQYFWLMGGLLKGEKQRSDLSASLTPLCHCALNFMGHMARWSFLLAEHPLCFLRSSLAVKASRESCLPCSVKGMHSVRAIQQIPLLRVRLTGTQGLSNWKTVHTPDANIANLPGRGREAVSLEEYLCGSSGVFLGFIPLSHMCFFCVLVFLNACEAHRVSGIHFRQPSPSSGNFKSLLPLEQWLPRGMVRCRGQAWMLLLYLLFKK